MLTRRNFLLSTGAACGLTGLRPAQAASAPIIAAASSLRFVLADLTKQFEHETGETVRLTFGSSGNLYRQISQGAPFQLFLSANESYVQKLNETGHTQDGGTVYAAGRLALAARQKAPLALDADLRGLDQAVRDGVIKRFAIANPSFAPYGVRAREVLENAKLWKALEPKLLLAESIAQAAQFTLSHATDGGIIALAHAVAGPMKGRLKYVALADHWHHPLNQRQVLLSNAGPTARAFHDFILSPKAAQVFQRSGFTAPTKDR